MKHLKKLLSFALALAMIAGVTTSSGYFLKAEAASDRPVSTGIPGDANGDGRLSVSDLVRVVVEFHDGTRLASADALFENGQAVTAEDIEEVRQRLLYNATGTVTVDVTGIDSNPTVTVARENGVQVYQGEGGFSTVLPVGNYVVTAESETAVAKTERFVLDGTNPAAVSMKMLPRVTAATYVTQWDNNTAEFVFEPDTGIYRGAYGVYNTGVLAAPAAVTAEDEWMLEADVWICSDYSYPSVGFALYNGSNYAENVKFEIVRTTPGEQGNYSEHKWQLRVNGKDYAPDESGDSTAQWLAANQEVLQGKVRMTVVHTDGAYHMLLNGESVCAITGEEAAAITNTIQGWDSIRLGFYAEQEATFENWSYSTDVSKYITEWMHTPFVYDTATGYYMVTDHDSVANGGYLAGISMEQGTPFLFETVVRDMDTETWPSAGIIVGTDKDNYVRFSIIRNTDANPNVYALRVGNVNSKEIVKWFSDMPALSENKPFGENDSDDMKLSLVYSNGNYQVYVNGAFAASFSENDLLSGEVSIKESLGEGAVKLGLFAERKVTFVDWSCSDDISKHIVEWIHEPFVRDEATGGYLVTDHDKTANGGYLAGAYIEAGTSFRMEAAVRDMDTETWPSAGIIVGTDKDNYVRFSIIRNTEAAPNVYALRVGNASGNEIVSWFADMAEPLNGNKPFGENDSDDMKLGLAYDEGTYQVYVNDSLAISLSEEALLSDVISIKDSLGEGAVKLGLFAERMVTFADWSYSTDISDVVRLESATYINQWGGYTADFVFEPYKAIYRGTYGVYNTGVLETPAAVTAEDEWALEADVQILSDWQYPSVGFALYNGSNYAENVKFEIVRTTPEPYGDYSGHKWQLRVNGTDYTPDENGDSTAQWLAVNQEALKGKVRLALVHKDGKYGMFINGTYMCAITEAEASALNSSWGSVRPGFYAEQEVTYENWSYTTDVSSYTFGD